MNINNIVKKLSDAFTVAGYARTASELLSFSDTQLSGLGLSRELLKQGASAHPWRVEVELKSIPNNVTNLEILAVELEPSNTQKAA